MSNVIKLEEVTFSKPIVNHVDVNEVTKALTEESDRYIYISYICFLIIFISFYSVGYLGPYAAVLCCCGLALAFIGYFVRNMWGYDRKRDVYLPL